MSNQANEHQELEKRRARKSAALWVTFTVAAIIVFLFLVRAVQAPASTTASSSGTGASPAPAGLLQDITSIPASVSASIGQGTASTLPKSISAPALTSNGKPQIVYVGAEYCPYCATERWPMVIALSRFGTFSNLQVSHSASGDVYPNTQTLSFHGTSYSSPYINFTGIEQYSNVPSGSAYETLDTPTQAIQSLMSTYDAPPYVAASSSGAIPFIDFGGKYLISGSTYQPSVLQGQSYAQIGSALSNPSSAISQGAVGAANTITAAICQLTGNMPASACTSTVQGLESKLGQ